MGRKRALRVVAVLAAWLALATIASIASIGARLTPALLPSVALASAHSEKASTVLLTSGTSAYPEAETMLAASSGAFAFSTQPRGATGVLLATDGIRAALWKTPASSVQLAVPTVGTRVPNPVADVSVSGSMVSVLEEGVSHPANFYVFTEYVPTGKVVVTKLPSGAVWQGASRDGFVMTVTTGTRTSPATTVYDLPQSGAEVQIGKTAITGFDVRVMAGPDAVLAYYYAKPETVIQYAVYAAKSAWQQLSRASQGSWACTSVSADWAGCYEVVGSGSSAETQLYAWSLRGDFPIEPSSPLSGHPADLRVLPTANALYWSYCQSSCTLTRMSDATGDTSTFSVPTPYVIAADQQAVWGDPAPGADESSSGSFAVSETGSSATHLDQAPLSPLSVAAVSVQAGTQASVTYVDNGSSGLGVFRSSITEASGQPLAVGKPVEVGQVDYAAPAGPASPVSLGDGGAAVAFSTDNPSGPSSSVGLAAWTGSKEELLGAQMPSGSALSVWSNWVVWLNSGVCHLYNLSTGEASTIALSRLGACAVGSGELAWAGAGGGVYMVKMTSSGPQPTSKAVAILGPSRGRTLESAGQIYIAPEHVGWNLPFTAPASDGGPGTDAGYRDYKTMAAPVTLGAGRDLDGISDLYLAQSWSGGVDPAVRGISTGHLTHLGSSSVSMSLSGDLVAWVGTDGLARIEQLAG